MSVYLSEALTLMQEGRQARRDEVVELPYPEDSSQALWWARGWLEEHRKINQISC